MEKEELEAIAAKSKSVSDRIEQELETLRDAYESVEKELQDKESEIESYENRLHANDPEMQILRDENQDLRSELQQLKTEKRELDDEIESLQRDAATLIEKDVKTSKERSQERKELHTVLSLIMPLLMQKIDELEMRLDQVLNEKERFEVQYKKEVESAIFGLTVQSARLQERLDNAEEQKIALKRQIEGYMNDEHTASGENERVNLY